MFVRCPQEALCLPACVVCSSPTMRHSYKHHSRMIMTGCIYRLLEEVTAPFDKFVHTSQRLSKIICFGSFHLSSSASDGNIQIIKFLC